MNIMNIKLKTIEYDDNEIEAVTKKCEFLLLRGWQWVEGGIDEKGLWGDYDPNKQKNVVQLSIN